ncbi:MAG TPA: rhodanese-like domain-containing protein [Pyrinomonadaceae bacterium]|jgi:UPF0176 protein|nr:rhodanese-like domain-containing protein [Pyrinomonadaceae bacterium]HVQ56943.1 rhodanese-like domain-containing protein [Pyrinomonadaceae bacterium]
MTSKFQIINFYEFKELGTEADLIELKSSLRDALIHSRIFGTIIIAREGYNASLCGEPQNVAGFIPAAEQILNTRFDIKSSFHDRSPFRKHEVRIKPEIVTLKRNVDLSLGSGTHVDPSNWNPVISDPEVYVLDTRNDYEFRSGTFRGAVNPGTEKFSDLPAFVEEKLDPVRNKKVAMFCTGGIRCEKFAPYLRAKGFTEVYQLRGGILAYLDRVPEEERLWEGECFVFDERVTLNEDLAKGESPDLSQRHASATDRSSSK